MNRNFTVPTVVRAALGLIWSFVLAGSVMAVDASVETTEGERTGKAETARQAFELLRTRCYQCHGLTSKYEDLDVLNREVLVNQNKYLTPGDAKGSVLWDAVRENRMPSGASNAPESRNRLLTLEEKETLKRWIEQGAEFPEQGRFGRLKRVTPAMVLKGVRDFLQDQDEDKRRFFKFFSIANVYNNPANSDEDVAIHRAALFKILNSISRSSRIVLPRAIPDSGETVYVVDWSGELKLDLVEHWKPVLQEYPFGVKYSAGASDELSRLYRAIEDSIRPEIDQDGIYVIRADWFVTVASRPPLYHLLAGIPQTFSELEKELGVKAAENFDRDLCRRIAIQRSGVSKQNRVLEWHDTQLKDGTLWVSYDFVRNVGKATIEVRPLGPPDYIKDAELRGFAFEHDGGEIIYSRSNGLHGYMLMDKTGKRIDAGPIDIVSDPTESGGTPQIINGVSCMHCHREGMLSKFEAPPDSAVIGNTNATAKVRRIYSNKSQAENRFNSDREQYLRSLAATIGPVLLKDYDRLTPEQRLSAIGRFSDPISKVAIQYRGDLGISQVAIELDQPVAELAAFAARLDDPSLKKLGVGPLVKRDQSGTLQSGVIKRELWEERQLDGVSLFQTVALKLQIGSIINHTKPK